MATKIHPTAVIDPAAQLGEGVTVGPYAVIDGDVEIGDGTTIGPQVVIAEYSRIGRECRIFHGASIGHIPQDVKFKGEKTYLRIGDRTTIREFCTMNRGTQASGETVIGNDCLFLAYCHVGHDCRIGDHVIASNNLALGGHVQIGNWATIGGVCGFHQFTRIGDYCMIGAHSYVTQDVVPYALTGYDPVRIVDVNRVKLERCDFSPERVQEIRRAFRVLFRGKMMLEEALEQLATQFAGNADVQRIVDFSRSSERGLLRMKAG